jgi:NAD(P)H-hydrate epimerase
MIKLLTAAEMREVDQATAAVFGLGGVVLMEHAGKAVAQAALDLLGPGPHHVCVVCGKGNNGGDGYVIARYLRNAGWPIRLFVLARPEEISGCAGTFLSVVRKMGVEPEVVIGPADLPRLEAAMAGAWAIVDALLGTGLAGPVRSPYSEVIEAINAAQREVISVDIPSGLDANTGMPLGACVKAAITVTYAGAKVGFYKGEGPALAGDIRIIDIGIPWQAYEHLGVTDRARVFGR